MKGVWRAAMAGVVLATGCTSVRMVQRDGCWIRETERFPKQVTEELGPCSRPPPQWSDDRLARMVQECMVQADYRWHNRAIQAWSQHQPLPPQESEEKMLNACLNQAAKSLLAENESLKSRLSELSTDRDALKAAIDKDDAFLRQSHDRLTAALGEAAKKPAPSAVATATSDGRASTQSDLSAQPGVAALTAVPMPMPLQMPAQTAAKCTLPEKPSGKSSLARKSTSAAPAPSCPRPWANSVEKVADVAPPVDKAAAPTTAPAPDANNASTASPGHSTEP